MSKHSVPRSALALLTVIMASASASAIVVPTPATPPWAAASTAVVGDSGWLSDTPSPRATAAVGEFLAAHTSALYSLSAGWSARDTFAALAETVVGGQYMLATHEGGHASRVRAAGGTYRYDTGSSSYWSYLLRHRPTAEAWTEWSLPLSATRADEIVILGGGFNAATLAATGSVPAHWAAWGRLSTLAYYFSPPSPDLDDLRQMQAAWAADGLSITPRDMRAWQLGAYALGRSGALAAQAVAGMFGWDLRPVADYVPDLTTWCGPRGVSIRGEFSGRTVAGWGWSASLEAVVQGRSTWETALALQPPLVAGWELAPRILIGEHGVGGGVELQRRVGRLAYLLGAAAHNPRTMEGERLGRSLKHTSLEVYVQLRLAIGR